MKKLLENCKKGEKLQFHNNKIEKLHLRIKKLQGLPSLNVGTSHSYRGPQMEQLLPLPLFLIRP